MAEHYELVAEMPILEQMGTQERQKLAKKRRLQQLKKWGHREKEWIAKEKQLNKRLATILSEENNGLNLKQYTTYSSNHRSKKKLQLTTATGPNGTQNGTSNYNVNNNHHDYLNNNTSSSLQPNGRVHFNVGVMLLEAAARNDFDEVKRLLMLGVSPDSVNHDGLTALHQCCIDASEPMMNLLLEFGANVDAKDTEQWTPLHAACTCGHLNLVKILVENGANLLAVNGDGNMPFDICEDEATAEYIESQMVKRGITQEMIDYTRASTEMKMLSDLEKQISDGLDLDWADKNGVTQLHVAAANGYLSVVKLLLKYGVNVNVCDNDLWRPLHGAACWGNEQHVKVVELLVEAGAQLDAKTINDETVFDLCDNAELLSKLNQLKDELESKQDSGTDRLRRTQSRTNSRVHSVRRTSVRDKNQISRRDAREEALLRTDSSTSSMAQLEAAAPNAPTNGEATATATSQSAPPKTANSQQDNELSILADGSTTSKNHPKNESMSRISLPDETSQPTPSTVSSMDTKKSHDEVDHPDQRALSKKTNSNGITSTSLSDNAVQEASRSQDSSLESTTSKRATNQQTQLKEAATTTTEDDNQPRSFSSSTIQDNQQQLTAALKQQGKLSTTSLTLPSAGAKTITKSLVIVNGKAPQTTFSTSAVAVSNNNNGNPVDNEQKQRIGAAQANDVMYQNDCDSNTSSLTQQKQQQQQQQLTQSVVVQSLAPINYTLSNLKKQRSDLRMRTTSIGGGTVSSSSNDQQQQQQQHLKQQATAADSQGSASSRSSPQHQTASSSNGRAHRVESPSLTFRKFSGEPSEVIGAGERNSKHKCCILI